jgi:hypothetical protein
VQPPPSDFPERLLTLTQSLLERLLQLPPESPPPSALLSLMSDASATAALGADGRLRWESPVARAIVQRVERMCVLFWGGRGWRFYHHWCVFLFLFCLFFGLTTTLCLPPLSPSNIPTGPAETKAARAGAPWSAQSSA